MSSGEAEGGPSAPRLSPLAWVRDRLGWDDIAHLAAKKEVPIHRHTVFYYLGGMALFLFLVQVATGILLLLYYRPSATEAFESVQYIMAEVPFGWLIRSIHAWGANLFVGVVLLHLASVFFLKAYRAPREMTWISGAILLFLTFGFGFSGYLLPWNTLSYFATKVGTDVPAQIPGIGPLLSRILRGGSDVTGATLSRFYGIHVAILPAITTLFLGLHLILVQKKGMSVPPSVERERSPRTMRFVPDFLLRDMVGWLTAVGLLAALSAFFPYELGRKADPFASAPAGIRPEWYFLSMFQALKYLPAEIAGVPGETLGVLFFGALAVVLVGVPLLDRGSSAGRPSPWWNRLAAVALLGALLLALLALLPAPGEATS
ncbi:MAG: cytochrome bc complex cytochrome b subunit [Thermoanaerobaculia bacterium]